MSESLYTQADLDAALAAEREAWAQILLTRAAEWETKRAVFIIGGSLVASEWYRARKVEAEECAEVIRTPPNTGY